MKMFMLVLSVSIISYGIFMTALLHPHLHLDWDILLRVLFRPSFAVFGDPGIESFERMFPIDIYFYSSMSLSLCVFMLLSGYASSPVHSSVCMRTTVCAFIFAHYVKPHKLFLISFIIK